MPRRAAVNEAPLPLPWPPADADHLLVTAAEMASLEERLFASGLPVEALMEKAALAVSRLLLADLAGEGKASAVVVLVGPGHNGGDGLVVARELHRAGVPVSLWSPFERHRSLTEAHLRHALWLGIPRRSDPPDPAGGELWVDALFGIGQNRAPGEEIESLLERRQRLRPGALVAIDGPTGICADSGRRLGAAAAVARLTWCLGLLKRGLVQDPALAHVGRLERVDLGLPAVLLADLPRTVPLGLGADAPLAARDAAQAPRPCPDPAAAKYARGRLLVVAGSPRYRGAAHLVLAGATASGCGSLRAAVPRALAEGLWSLLPHVVLEPPAGLAATAAGELDLAGLAGPALERLDALLVGPGLGDPGGEEGDPDEVWERLRAFPGLLVLDADGLNRLARRPVLPWLGGRAGPTWLTPHSGEFARLFPDLAALPPLEAAAAAAGGSGAAVLLKGARTVVAAPDGRRWQILRSCPEAARAGLGDVLAGYAAGLGAMAAAGGPTDATLLAVAALDHARAGCHCRGRRGPGGAAPLAVARALGRATVEQ